MESIGLGILKALGMACVLAAFSQGVAQAADSFDFAVHRVDAVYEGKLSLPDFKGRDKDFALFKTRITEAMKAGVTFAGEYSVAQFGCGSGCTNVVVASNRTGQLYSFPRGGENNQGLELKFDRHSNLMVMRWYTDSSWESCIFESFVFNDGRWIAGDALASKGDETCSGDVIAGVNKARGH
ncbi:hypothetical protein N2601_12725 [Rhizobium sp. CB3060]|uniref:hypothetical protein n=1 Tax=Rhizobium sp. CB3060 TaxID=3138255 RepID=UPI0021A31575|nr:hypothetical protein [Rhizobium tropici]UWU20158.1 hypothetical protein N2601_12725 [Rhizobium tropici]